MLRPVKVTPPAITPVTLIEAKAHCRVDHTDDDTLITSLIAAVTSHLDGYTGILGRALITQTWQQDYYIFSDPMRIPLGDLLTVTAITYWDINNASQTLATSVYESFVDELGYYVTLKPLQVWPGNYGRSDAVRIAWTTGYGPAITDVPEAIRHGIKMLVAQFYENREPVVLGQSVEELPMSVRALLYPFRRYPIS